MNNKYCIYKGEIYSAQVNKDQIFIKMAMHVNEGVIYKGNMMDGNALNIGNIKIITKYPIEKVEKINDKYIVLLNIPRRVELGKDELNNILCYDEKGKMCWQISDKLPSAIISKEQIPYIAIRIVDEKLYVTDFWGRQFNVDVENGELLDVKIVH